MKLNLKKIGAILLCAMLIFLFAACKKEPAKTLYMATEGTFEPYEFYDGEKLVGIDVEIAQAICDKLGYKLEVVDTAFDTIIAGVKSGKYDFAMAGLTVTEDRLKEVGFSDSYSTGVQVIIVLEGSDIKSVDDLFKEGAYNVIGSQTGTTGNLYATWDIEEAEVPLGEVKGFAKTTDAATALKNGQVDCIILDSEPAKKIAEKNPGFKILDTEYVVEDYAIAIAKENTKLMEEINGALNALIKDGTVQKIVDKYINE